MNNTDLTKRQLEVNSGGHEQHGPNQNTTEGEPCVHEQHGPNQMTTEGEYRSS